jgi:hypothetical protein
MTRQYRLLFLIALLLCAAFVKPETSNAQLPPCVNPDSTGRIAAWPQNAFVTVYAGDGFSSDL